MRGETGSEVRAGTGWTAADRPIAAAMIPFPGVLPDGRLVQDAAPEDWHRSLSEVCKCGL